MSDAPHIRIEDRPAASNVLLAVSGTVSLSGQASNFGYFLEPPSEEATPTLADLYNQMIAARAESQLNHVSLTHGINRIVNATSAVDQLSSTGASNADRPNEPAPMLVSLAGVTRSVAAVVMALCSLSLIFWTLQGFILINPAASIVLLVASIMAVIMSRFMNAPTQGQVQ